jgi:hypothetical protein
MNGTRRFDVMEHLSEGELDIAINEAQKADEAEWSAEEMNTDRRLNQRTHCRRSISRS